MPLSCAVQEVYSARARCQAIPSVQVQGAVFRVWGQGVSRQLVQCLLPSALGAGLRCILSSIMYLVVSIAAVRKQWDPHFENYGCI